MRKKRPAEGRSLVGVDGEAVRPDLHLLVAQGSRVQHNLDVMLVLVMVFMVCMTMVWQT